METFVFSAVDFCHSFMSATPYMLCFILTALSFSACVFIFQLEKRGERRAEAEKMLAQAQEIGKDFWGGGGCWSKSLKSAWFVGSC